MFEWQKLTIGSMQAQLNFLKSAHSHHLLWADHTEEPDLKKMHIQLSESLKQIIDQYIVLLASYNRLAREKT